DVKCGHFTGHLQGGRPLKIFVGDGEVISARFESVQSVQVALGTGRVRFARSKLESHVLVAPAAGREGITTRPAKGREGRFVIFYVGNHHPVVRPESAEPDRDFLISPIADCGPDVDWLSGGVTPLGQLQGKFYHLGVPQWV